jgi:hypothetical protein
MAADRPLLSAWPARDGNGSAHVSFDTVRLVRGKSKRDALADNLLSTRLIDAKLRAISSRNRTTLDFREHGDVSALDRLSGIELCGQSHPPFADEFNARR